MRPNLRRRPAITEIPATRRLVDGYVAGETVDDAISATRRLTDAGMLVSIHHLGEDPAGDEAFDDVARCYRRLIEELRRSGLSGRAEVSVKPSAIGQDHQQSMQNARAICAAADAAGSSVTVEMEDHTSTDDILTAVADLRHDHPEVGLALQSSLRRTESDCRDLAVDGSRIRLCKGAYAAPQAVAYSDRHQIAKSFVRCLKILINSPAYPMIATQDERLIAIAETLAHGAGRSADSYEFQLLYGIGRPEQRRLLRAGHRVRVYLPYGPDWSGYLIRRLAERPAMLMAPARSLVRR